MRPFLAVISYKKTIISYKCLILRPSLCGENRHIVAKNVYLCTRKRQIRHASDKTRKMQTGLLFSVLPLLACTFWFVRLSLRYGRNDAAQRMLTVFFGICTVLYSCHALLYNVYAAEGLPRPLEALWAACSLSVYPVYFLYICRLTARPLQPRAAWLILAPGLLVALAILIAPGKETDTVRAVLNGLQVLCVASFGYRRLKAFDRELQEFYAETEGKDVRTMRWLLVAILLTSAETVVLNILGREQVVHNNWLILAALDPIALLLFALGYIGYTRTFHAEQYISDNTKETDAMLSSPTPDEQFNALGPRIEQLMVKEAYYLHPNITISDVAREVGSCRTYVSNYINQQLGCSFSDYVNRLRVEHAKMLIMQHDRHGSSGKLSTIATDAGFSGEQSFYRNFRKFTGMTPAAWLETNRETRRQTK